MFSESDEKVVQIPVTIITGFLGAGKTTLISRLVRECSGKRIAVIQNEVSEEMGIESSVLTDSSGNIIPDFFELPNGCVCCSAKDNMILALDNIISLGKERIDAIVVETTGIADPCAVAELFWVDTELGSSLMLDGVLAVVDCLNFPLVISENHSMGHSEIGRRQVAVADRILLNKTDLVDSTQSVRDLITTLNPCAELIETSQSTVNADWVLNIGSFTPKRAIDTFSHSIPSTVDHVLIHLTRNFEICDMERRIGELCWDESHACGEIYRIKGIFIDTDKSWRMVQGVGLLFEMTELTLPPPAGTPKLLLIGSNLKKKLIESKFS
jgi:G3E family GTPase